jgi:hypothetical protein
VPSPIIARADALMHRRRQSDSELDDIPVLTDSIDPFDDIPVLTDIEPMPEDEDLPETTIAISEPAVEELADELAEALQDEQLADDQTERERLIEELAGRIEARIKVVLPEIISSTIREFLAEQEMIENS